MDIYEERRNTRRRSKQPLRYTSTDQKYSTCKEFMKGQVEDRKKEGN